MVKIIKQRYFVKWKIVLGLKIFTKFIILIIFRANISFAVYILTLNGKYLYLSTISCDCRKTKNDDFQYQRTFITTNAINSVFISIRIIKSISEIKFTDFSISYDAKDILFKHLVIESRVNKLTW